MKVIRLKEVQERTGLARATIYKYMSNNEFPKTISLGARSVGWIEGEVDSWISAKFLARDA